MAYSPTVFQLTHLLQNIYSDLGQTDAQFGIFNATGGGTTSFINTNWGSLESPPETDVFKNDFAIVVRDAAGAGAAPEGEYALISAYADATQTATIGTVTSAIGSGDTIMLAKQANFPIQQVIFCINRALQNLGDIPLVNTSITTANQQTEYTLPITLKRGDILRVEIQGVTTDSNDNRWTQISNWDLIPATPGSTGLLILPQYASGYNIKIIYKGIHPVLASYADPISETLHPALVTMRSIVEVLSWYNAHDGNQGASEYYVWLEREYREKRLPEMAIKHFVWQPKQATKWFVAGNPVYDLPPDPITQ